MQPAQFQYTLSTGSTDFILPNAPKSWDENLIEWKRSNEYHGMVKTLTLPLNFVKDGADYIRAMYWAASGVESRVTVKIAELNTDTYQYETRYIGSLDFSTYDDDGIIVTIAAVDAGIQTLINANDGIKYTIPLDLPEAVTITVPPIPLLESTTFLIGENFQGTDYFPKMNIIINDIKSVNKSTFGFDHLSASPAIFQTQDRFFFEAQTDGLVTSVYRSGETSNPVGSLTFLVQGRDNHTIDIALYNQNGTKIKTFYSRTFSSNGSYFETCQLDFTYNALKGDRLFLYTNVTPDEPGLLNSTSGIQGSMELTYNTISPGTTCKCLKPFDVFKYLVKQMNNGIDYPCASRYLTNTRAKNILLTSGDALRQLSGANIITTFKDFFKSFYADAPIGFGIENGNATIEDFGYWYKSQLRSAKIKDLPKNPPRIQPATDYMYSSIKVGYEDQTYDQLNGKDEVCSTQYWKTPITRIESEYDIVSAYRADIHGIEIARINLDGRTDADNSAGDNDVFLIKVTDSLQVETSSEYGAVTGVLTGSATYNIDLWPKHMLLRHGSYLRSMLDRLDSGRIIFTSGLKNYTASSIGYQGSIIENENIEVGSLGAKIFLPIYFTIDTDYPIDMLQLLDANPTGYIEFPYAGKLWRGFNDGGTVDISKDSNREFKLLLCVPVDGVNDFTPLLPSGQ